MELQQTYFHFLSTFHNNNSEGTHNFFVLSSDIVMEQHSVVNDRKPPAVIYWSDHNCRSAITPVLLTVGFFLVPMLTNC